MKPTTQITTLLIFFFTGIVSGLSAQAARLNPASSAASRTPVDNRRSKPYQRHQVHHPKPKPQTETKLITPTTRATTPVRKTTPAR